MIDFKAMALSPLQHTPVRRTSTCERDAVMKRLIEEFGLPETQYGCAQLAAMMNVRLGVVPSSDRELVYMSWTGARGLFGEENFDNASDAQRWEWMEICERALRDTYVAEGLWPPRK